MTTIVAAVGKVRPADSTFTLEYPPVTQQEAELLFRTSDLAIVKRLAFTVIGLNEELDRKK